MTSTLADVIHKYRLKTGTAAMQSSGMQLELAAHLMLMASGTNSVVILRAGAPPNYDRPTAPKPGNIRTKSSKDQGFFNGYISADHNFSRIERDCNGNSTLIGIHGKDHHRLKEPITAPDHLHTIQLKVTLKDIVEQLRSNGDLQVKDFNPVTGQLELQFKPGKGALGIQKTFVIRLDQAKDFIPYFSRPWNAPSNHAQTPQELSDILKNYIIDYPDYFAKLSEKEFPVFIRDKELLTPAKVFAKNPQSIHELEQILLRDDPSKLSLIAHATFSQALKLLGQDALEKLYHQYLLPITGDWDGLAIGHPASLNAKYLRTYNTLVDDDIKNDIEDLIIATDELLQYFKNKATSTSPLERSPFDKFILKIDFYTDLCDEFRIFRAGIITPYEFLFQQLTNHAYSQATNEAFGEHAVMHGMQEALDYIIAYAVSHKAPWNLSTPPRVPNSIEISGLITAAKIKLAKIRTDHPIHRPCRVIQAKSEAHLEHSIRSALNPNNFFLFKSKHEAERANSVKRPLVKITHPDADPNVQNPFQHGVDMRSPYKPEANGAWVLITHNGMIIRGEDQCELTAILLCDDGELLRASYFDIHPQIDMRPNCKTGLGWGSVVEKQLQIDAKLNLHRVPMETKRSYEIFQAISNLEKKYNSKKDAWEESDKILLENIITSRDQHQQIISPNLLSIYSDKLPSSSELARQQC